MLPLKLFAHASSCTASQSRYVQRQHSRSAWITILQTLKQVWERKVITPLALRGSVACPASMMHFKAFLPHALEVILISSHGQHVCAHCPTNPEGASFMPSRMTDYTYEKMVVLMYVCMYVIVDTWVTGKHKLCCTRDWCCHEGEARVQHQTKGNITCVHQLPMYQQICCILSILPKAYKLHMQHHFLCNISHVVIAESVGKSLKYTSVYVAIRRLRGHHACALCNEKRF